MLPLLTAAEAADLIRGEWIADAKCGNDPSFTKRLNPDRQRLVCRQCPVQRECAHYGTLIGDRFFMYGAMTPRERRFVDNGQRWLTCETCYDGFLVDTTNGSGGRRSCRNCNTIQRPATQYAEV